MHCMTNYHGEKNRIATTERSTVGSCSTFSRDEGAKEKLTNQILQKEQ